MKRFLLITTLLFISAGVWGQCMLYPVPLADRVNQSSHIVEGRVLSSTSYWNTLRDNIYTVHKVYAYKLFKGSLANNGRVFYVVTEGGTMGLTRQEVSATLELHTGDRGVFFCNPSKVRLNGAGALSSFDKFEAYAGPQGFAEFTADGITATDPFAKYHIKNELYTKITAITGKQPVVLDTYSENGDPVINVAPTITSFTPDSASAGTKTVLTITGTDFGATRGASYVAFKNADNGGSGVTQPVDVEYISWTDTEIKVEITSKAGTGKIEVNNGSGTAQSTGNLVINFAQLNVKDANDIVYQPVHVGINGTGYTWQFYTDFNSNTAAKQSFLRAFQNWRCGTLINWDIGSTTTVNTIARDAVNVIRFDIGSELPNGVLGRCSSWWSGCVIGPTTFWYVAELDIVFDDGVNWNFNTSSPSISQYDFESVAVHELGHGHQLGHVINSSEIMHYSISNGQTKRALSSFGDLEGGNYVMDMNTAAAVCAKPIMKALNPNFCSLIPIAGFKASLTSVCPGSSIIFTDTSVGSTNAYTWDFGSGASPAIATGKGPHTVMYNTSGAKTVQLIVEGVVDNDTTTKVDYINILPAKPAQPGVITGPDTGCMKQQLFTINSVPTALGYSWGVIGGGTTDNSTDTSVVITFSNPGAAHTIWVRAANVCGSSSDSSKKSLTVINNPKAGFTYTIQNDTIRLSDTSLFGNSYTWKFGTNQTNPNRNLNLIPNQSGTFSVTMVVANFCGADSVTKQISFVKSSVGETINKVGLLVYPNPAEGSTVIKIEDVARYKGIQFELYDVIGRVITTIELTSNETTLNLQNLAAGMYAYKVRTTTETLAAGRLVIK